MYAPDGVPNTVLAVSRPQDDDEEKQNYEWDQIYYAHLYGSPIVACDGHTEADMTEELKKCGESRT